MFRTFSKKVVALITVAAIIIFAWTLVHATVYAPDSELYVLNARRTVAATSMQPVRLIIPSLSIDANVQHVGIGSKGNMAVPSNYTDVGWYRYGTAPGRLGSAVIDGHVDNGLALPGVFKHLSDIKKGADVYVMIEDGARLHFIVTDVQLYPYKEAPVDLIFNQADTARLNLITCDGAWVQGDRTYDHRLVVFTELQKS
jgi:sortase (surface protein transpeptidase)